MSSAPLWLQLLILGLGCARITVLATGDRITRAVRWPVIRRFGEESYPGYLAGCPWCAGWWVALASVLAWFAWPIGTTTFMLPWAVAYVAGALASLGPKDELPEALPEPPPPDLY